MIVGFDGNVFPAHAGVIPIRELLDEAVGCLPRACGGDPKTVASNKKKTLSSPRMRG